MCQWVSVRSSVAAPGLIVQRSYSDNKSLYFCNLSLKYWILSALGIFRNAIAQKKKHQKNPHTSEPFLVRQCLEGGCILSHSLVSCLHCSLLMTRVDF